MSCASLTYYYLLEMLSKVTSLLFLCSTSQREISILGTSRVAIASNFPLTICPTKTCSSGVFRNIPISKERFPFAFTSSLPRHQLHSNQAFSAPSLIFRFIFMKVNMYGNRKWRRREYLTGVLAIFAVRWGSWRADREFRPESSGTPEKASHELMGIEDKSREYPAPLSPLSITDIGNPSASIRRNRFGNRRRSDAVEFCLGFGIFINVAWMKFGRFISAQMTSWRGVQGDGQIWNRLMKGGERISHFRLWMTAEGWQDIEGFLCPLYIYYREFCRTASIIRLVDYMWKRLIALSWLPLDSVVLRVLLK